MQRYRALVVKDLRAFFDQPTGYVLLVLFVGALSYFFFRSAFLTGQASLRPLFDLVPWFLTVLVPATTMRLLAEEERDGTMELLLTHPVREIDVVLSKFVAGWLFIAIALAATIGIPLLLSTAGDLDVGAIVAQYVGALLLAAALVAVGVWASSMTRNQIVAFLLSVGAGLALLLSGLEFIFAPLAPPFGTLVRDLSLLTRFQSVARGVLDLGDMLYFVGVVLAFLSIAYWMVRRRAISHASRGYRVLQSGILGLVVLGVALGWLGAFVPGRLDLTEGRVHTLSPATVQLAKSLDDRLTIQLFASKNLPTEDALRYRDVRDLLADYERASGGNVRVTHLYPDEDEEAATEAERLGIPQVQFNVFGENQLSVQGGYLGIALLYKDGVETIPFIKDAAGLEYRIASLTHKLAQVERKTIGFLTGHGERERNLEYLIITAALSEQFEVVDVAPAEDGSLDLTNIDVLVVAGPTKPIPEPTRAAVSAYLSAGGKALMLIEPVTVDTATLTATANPESFADFVARYGVDVNEDLVYDLRANETLAFGSSQGSILIPYPFWAHVLVQDQQVLGNVETVLTPWASSVVAPEEGAGATNMEITPLMETTPFAGRLRDSFLIRPRGAEPPGPAVSAVSVGVAVQESNAAPDASGGLRMVVIGDADWLSDNVIRRSSGNLVAGLNLIDWLAQEEALVRIRSKGTGPRLLLFGSSMHQTVVRFGNMVGVPALILLLGLVRYSLRRRATRRVYRHAD